MDNQDNRNIIILDANHVEFTQYGCWCVTGEYPKRVKRLVTDNEMEHLKELIVHKDTFGIDNFCYNIC